MSTTERGGDLFIVDNSDSGWTGLRYLKDWTDISTSFDIATGYFEIGSLLELDGHWQKLEKIRILMGDEVTHRTRRALLDAVRARAESKLDSSIEDDKEANPFLKGVDAVVEALSSKKIECRVYNRDKFHAKTYITHAKMDVVGSQALVGSSNFTRPGLTQNVELNIQVKSGREVSQLQEWFDKHWDDAADVTDDILKIITRHTALFSPFDIYSKALHEYFKGHEITASEWEEDRSRVFSLLGQYQKEAYWTLLKIARQHGGAFLCDGVGLGKTYVGLMLIERLILHDGKRVVLFAPKGTKEAVWEPHLKEILPHIGGIGGGADFSNLAVFSHTDLNRGGDFPERFKRMAELADVVIIDEAHHFRNPGSPGDPESGEGRSRYFQLYDLLDDELRTKTLFMLTATPINNRLTDFRHMAELFTRRDETFFANTLGVHNLRRHFSDMEKELLEKLERDSIDLSDDMDQVGEFLSQDTVFGNLVVQRSRAYVKESQKQEDNAAAIFPERRAPQVAAYSLRQSYGRLLDLVEEAFQKDNPLFSLPIYYTLAYYQGDDESIDPREHNRQKQLVGLIRTLFLKRFESSIRAFELSCLRLMQRLLAFVEINSQSDTERKVFERWKLQNAGVLSFYRDRKLEFWADEDDSEVEDDVIPAELLEGVDALPRSDYRVEDILSETLLDLDQIVKFLNETREFKPQNDDKMKKLVRLLKSKDLQDQKVIVFTEFADTARYLREELEKTGIEGITQIDSGTKTNRATIIRRFSPYYNGASTPELVKEGVEEIRVLISTDVLSEGLNLQDACRLINYDIHWNPVRLMQRIGRVDRRLNPDTEKRLIADHPRFANQRGKVAFWNFLPPGELNEILSLYQKVTQKTLLISETMGIEGKKLLTPEDQYEPLKQFNHLYEGSKTAVEDMHLEYQSLLRDNPDLANTLDGFPRGIFSGRKRLSKGVRGVFFCYGLPALDREADEFTEEAGTTRWYLYDVDKNAVFEEPGEILESIRSNPKTARRCRMEEPLLLDIRKKVRAHIKDSYEKLLDIPLDAPKPSLKCWMEMNEE